MNTQTVTPETGRKLAAAGFPQPAPAPGRWWGNEEAIVFVWREREEEEVEKTYFTVTKYECQYPYPDQYFDLQDFAGLVYLPSVGDILRELPQTSISCAFGGANNEIWYAIRHNTVFHAKHPAEAAAAAWLSIHEKN